MADTLETIMITVLPVRVINGIDTARRNTPIKRLALRRKNPENSSRTAREYLFSKINTEASAKNGITTV